MNLLDKKGAHRTRPFPDNPVAEDNRSVWQGLPYHSVCPQPTAPLSEPGKALIWEQDALPP